MPYTLLKFLGWLIAALLIGLLIGWWLWGRRSSQEASVESAPAPDAVSSDGSNGALFDALIAERDQLAADLDACRSATATPNVTEAAVVLGRKIVLDDLTVVEGVGPRIGQLCHSIGIRTWWALANTEVDVLRAMLNDAGPRFQMHDPTSWPEQARLLAHGQWREFAELTRRLHGGRTAE
ncbi:MAG TPA: hypothetical protein DCR14_07900 [Acidimicrobiaceae bacterium]|nr:hypothetical protein [Acidimicrobiaceae bacterium]